MLLNRLQIASRHLGTQRFHTIINICGLAVGIGVTLLIVLFIHDERSYDAFQRASDRVFRITVEDTPAEGSATVERVMLSPALATSVGESFPEIASIARLSPVGPGIQFGEKSVQPAHFFYGDPSIFKILTLNIIAGDPIAALEEPETLALSEGVARRLFGDLDPVGQTVTVGSRDGFVVVGVFQDTPTQTHLHVDVIGSIKTLDRWFPGALSAWDSPNYITYALLKPGTNSASLKTRLAGFLKDVPGRRVPRTGIIRIQNIREIHLHSTVMTEPEPQGDNQTIVLLSAIAGFIILLAGINFSNLAIAASTRREREVGVRKAAGASRLQLFNQFMGEAFLTTILATILGLILVEIFLPSFNQFVGKDVRLNSDTLTVLLVPLLSGVILVSLLAGGYPALYLSSLRPVAIFHGSRGRSGRNRLRSILVVFQFAVASVLILATSVVFRQLNFVQRQDLGFDPGNVLILPEIRSIAADFEPFRDELMQNPDIENVSQSIRAPLGGVIPPFKATAFHTTASVNASVYPLWIDDHYFDTYRIPIRYGRNLDATRVSDMESGLILNEAAARALGWEHPGDAIGETVELGATRHIIGIAGDFHQESLRKAIIPIAFYTDTRNFRAISVRYRTNNFPEMSAFLESHWKRYNNGRPVSYDVLAERVESSYLAEKRLGALFLMAAGLGLFIACIGLIGISAVTISARRKEMGIRKALGASTTVLASALTLQFTRLSTIAAILGITVGYSLMARWLNAFAFHYRLGPIVGLIAAGIVLVSSTGAVLHSVIRTARVNPVESLRHE